LAEDVLRAAPAATILATVAATSDKIVPLSPMRRIVGERMRQSKQTAPHFYLTMDIDMTGVSNLRAARKEHVKDGAPSLNDFILQACARFAAPPAKQGGSTTGGGTQPAAPAKPKAPPVTYVVKGGDTMSGIAKRELGSSARWPEIYRITANRKLIGPNPGLIKPGQRLVMPAR